MLPETIPPKYAEFVEQELASGRYRSVQEVMADGLRLLRERKLFELRKVVEGRQRQSLRQRVGRGGTG